MGLFVAYKRLLCLTTLLAIALTPLAVGQTQSDQDLMSLNLEDLTHVKVYSASRHLEDVRQAPAAVTVITAQEMQRYGWRTLGDALNSLRGFYTSYDRLYSYLGVRGFLRPGDYNCRILVLVNGHRLNENVYDAAPIGSEFPLDPELIDHIEIVRGPGSSLFGTNAVFGVINVITRQPAAETGLEISGETSSFWGRTGRFTGTGHRGRFSGLVAGSLYLNPGQSRLFFPEFATPQTNNGYAENMDGMRAQAFVADLHYANFRLQGSYGDRGKKFPTASSGTIFNDPTAQMDDQRAYLDASYQRSFSARTDLDVRAYYDEYNTLGQGAYASPMGRVIAVSKAHADWMGVEANLGRQIGKQRVTIGGNYEYSIDLKQRAFWVGLPDLFRADHTTWLTAAYGEIELYVVPKLTINAGGRLDWFSTFGGAFSPRIALIYSPSSRTSVKYIFGKAFRAPNASEEYYFDNATIEPAPRTLLPEQVRSHEVVVEHSLRSWLSLTGDGYYNQLEKLIDQVPDPNTGLTYFVNAGRVHSKGLEFEVQAKHASGIEGRASYELSTASNDVSHIRLTNSPGSQAKLNTTLPILRRGFAGIELFYVSAMRDYRGTRVPPFAVTNVTVSSRQLWGGWQFSASCYNALDRRWYSPMGPSDPEAAIQQDGRTYRFKVSYRLPLHDKPRQK